MSDTAGGCPPDAIRAPETLYYVPDFITSTEEEFLLSQVYSAPKPKWTNLSNRRLQNWGGLPHPKGMVTEELPKWLKTCCEKIYDLGVFEDKPPNHVLVNEYEAGQGIMPHEDGPLYFPTVSTISLGSHTLLDFYRPMKETPDVQGEVLCSSSSLEDRYVCSVLLQPRSLILVQDEMYKTYLHGIREVHSDTLSDTVVNLDHCKGMNVGDTLHRSTRVSLTIRHVPKLIKASLLFGRKR